MKHILIIVCSLLMCLNVIAATPAFYNVKDFGAKGDGKHIDSPAINAAIIKASESGAARSTSLQVHTRDIPSDWQATSASISTTVQQ